jgi:transposase
MIEAKVLKLIKIEHQDLLTRIETIPGLGKKTSIMLLVLTDGFERFPSSGELCSYAGLTPTIRQSGSSVRGKARISKMGNLLLICSFTACKHNKACKVIYGRMVAKG